MTNETQTYKNLKNKPKNNYPELLIIHHGGGTNAQPLLDTSNQTAQIYEAYHLSKGWDGLGYQYVIHKNGDIWKGRPEHRNGAHTVGYNEKSIGICLTGNFDATMPTAQQIVSLTNLMKDVMTRYTIKDIVPHRKFANKTCYGKNLSDTWAKNLINEIPKEMVSIPKSLIQELIKYLS